MMLGRNSSVRNSFHPRKCRETISATTMHSGVWMKTPTRTQSSVFRKACMNAGSSKSVPKFCNPTKIGALRPFHDVVLRPSALITGMARKTVTRRNAGRR